MKKFLKRLACTFVGHQYAVGWAIQWTEDGPSKAFKLATGNVWCRRCGRELATYTLGD
jgi:hypothetical protein